MGRAMGLINRWIPPEGRRVPTSVTLRPAILKWLELWGEKTGKNRSMLVEEVLQAEMERQYSKLAKVIDGKSATRNIEGAQGE